MSKVKFLRVLIGCVWLAIPKFGDATAQLGQSIYAISLNGTAASTVWKLNVELGTAQSIFSLPKDATLAANDAFSARELAVMQSSIDTGEMPQKVINQLTQSIIQIQPINDNQALIVTAAEVCNRNYMDLCFGYYDLQLLTFSATPTIISLLKLDYHPSELDEWNCLKVIRDPIVVEPMLINPIYRLVVVPIRASKQCYTQTFATKLIVLDFSRQPAVIMADLAMARNAAWSLDGNSLAYYVVDKCNDVSCDVRMDVTHMTHAEGGSFKNDATIRIDSLRLRASLLHLPPVWLDNDTLLYQWYTGFSNKVEFSIKAMGSEQQRSVQLEAGIEPHSLYHTAAGSMIIGTETITPITFSEAMKTWQIVRETIPIPQNSMSVFNPRNSNLIALFSYVGSVCLTQFYVYEPSVNKVIPFNVSMLIPENECVSYVYP